MERLAESGHPDRFTGQILVVDDDENNRDLLLRRLALEGHTLESAAGGRQALQMIGSRAYDLVLLDIMMPEMNGIEVLGLLREKHAPTALPVIMATAKDESQDVADALKIGANDYVTKPLDMVVLLARIQTQLRLLWYQVESERLGRLREEFMQIASHDLKSPLSHVIGYGNLIVETEQDEAEPNEEVLDFSRRIIDSAGSMQRIIEDFIDLHALEEGHLHLEVRADDLSALIGEVVEANRPAAEEKGLTIDIETDARLSSVPFDSPRITQVLENLIGNAIKFCSKGDRITIQSLQNGSDAVVEVRDTGPGLSEEDMKVAFDKYARLSAKPTGSEKSSGLGLAISRMMIASHGGRVGVRRNEAGGSTFWFTLPLKAAPRG